MKQNNEIGDTVSFITHVQELPTYSHLRKWIILTLVMSNLG